MQAPYAARVKEFLSDTGGEAGSIVFLSDVGNSGNEVLRLAQGNNV
ncbi:hypothetical protein QE436_000817 [Pantoea anthophila]|nr:hypothetical protein [Pantoea anthophila]